MVILFGALLLSLVGGPCVCQDLKRVTTQINGLTKMDENEDTWAAARRNLQAGMKLA